MKQYCHFVKSFSHAFDMSNMLCKLILVALSCHFCQFDIMMETVIRLFAGLLELLT